MNRAALLVYRSIVRACKDYELTFNPDNLPEDRQEIQRYLNIAIAGGEITVDAYERLATLLTSIIMYQTIDGTKPIDLINNMAIDLLVDVVKTHESINRFAHLERLIEKIKIYLKEIEGVKDE